MIPGEVTGNELVIALTRAMRLADHEFERVGGSTRHHVRDCLIPQLEAMGLHIVVSPPAPPEATNEQGAER